MKKKVKDLLILGAIVNFFVIPLSWLRNFESSFALVEALIMIAFVLLFFAILIGKSPKLINQFSEKYKKATIFCLYTGWIIYFSIIFSIICIIELRSYPDVTQNMIDFCNMLLNKTIYIFMILMIILATIDVYITHKSKNN